MVGWYALKRSFFETEISELDRLRQTFETALKGIREEFDDHLESINDNTNEIQAGYEYVTRVNEKLDRLGERIEQIEVWMARMTGVPVREEEEPGFDLNEKEKKICLILYTASETKAVTYNEIAEALDENEFLVRGYITNLIEKGIPITKRYVGRNVHLTLEASFREKQAKTNILDLNQKTVKEFCR